MSSGTGDKLKGLGDELRGRAKSAIGDATGNKSLQGEGAKDRAKGQARNTLGDAKDGLDQVGGKLGNAVDHLSDKLRGNKS